MKTLQACALVLVLSVIPTELVAQSRGKVAAEVLEAVAPRVVKEAAGGLAAASTRGIADNLVSRFGDDAVRFLGQGGRELIEVAGKQSEEVFLLVRSNSPEAIAALTRNFDELLPVIRQRGADVLELEARASGLGIRAARLVDSPDTLKLIARQAPAEDLPRLVSALERAESREARELITKSYLEQGAAFLRQIPPKLVLSVGAVIAAYQVAAGVRDGIGPISEDLGTIAKNNGLLVTLTGSACCLLLTLGLMGRFGFTLGSVFWPAVKKVAVPPPNPEDRFPEGAAGIETVAGEQKN